MRLALRVIIGVAGVLGLLVAVRLWMAPAELAGQLGVSASGPLGLATIRADMGGFFAAGGVFALAAAIKARGGLLLPSVVLIASKYGQPSQPRSSGSLVASPLATFTKHSSQGYASLS